MISGTPTAMKNRIIEATTLRAVLAKAPSEIDTISFLVFSAKMIAVPMHKPLNNSPSGLINSKSEVILPWLRNMIVVKNTAG